MQLRVFECKCLSVCVHVSVSVFELRLWLGSDVGDVCDVVATLRRLMLRFYCVLCRFNKILLLLQWVSDHCPLFFLSRSLST